MKYGLLPARYLKNKSYQFEINDETRFDSMGREGCICLSITNYNYYLLDRFKNRYSLNQGKIMNVAYLEIDPSVLWETDNIIYFYETNATNGSIRKNCHDTPEAFEKMFAPVVEYDVASLDQHRTKERCNYGLRDNETTDPQAEILFFGRIDPKYIKLVRFD